MSNQPDQPQPYAGTSPSEQGQPPYGQNPYGQPSQNPSSQSPYGQNPYGAPTPGQYGQPQYAQQQYGQPQYGAPTYYSGGPGYVDSTSGPRGLSLSSMIIGLASLFFVGMLIIPQIVGIILGHVGLVKESPQGRPFSISGLIINYLALLIYLGIYAFFIYFAASLGDYSDAPTSTFSSLRSSI